MGGALERARESGDVSRIRAAEIALQQRQQASAANILHTAHINAGFAEAVPNASDEDGQDSHSALHEEEAEEDTEEATEEEEESAQDVEEEVDIEDPEVEESDPLGDVTAQLKLLVSQFQITGS